LSYPGGNTHLNTLNQLKLKNIFEGNVIQLNEVDRLENLKNYKIWRTRSEPVFDQLAGIAAALLDVPVAMINFIDRYSIRLEQSSLCSIAIVKGYAASFEKSVADPVLISDPLVAGEYGWRFYAATDITTTEGLRIGTICIVDKMKRKFGHWEKKKLTCIADMVKAELNKRISALN
jgi:hypothetical protein